MPDLLELQPDLLANILPIRSLTHAPEVATEIRTQTTEFLVVTLETSFLVLLEDMLLLLLPMLPLEVLVEDKIKIFHKNIKSDCYKLLIAHFYSIHSVLLNICE